MEGAQSMPAGLSAVAAGDSIFEDFAAQRSVLLRSAVEDLYSADCALQAAIDTAKFILGPAGHVSVSGDIKARNLTQKAPLSACKYVSLSLTVCRRRLPRVLGHRCLRSQDQQGALSGRFLVRRGFAYSE